MEKYSLVLGKDFLPPWEDCLQERISSIYSVVYTIKQLQPEITFIPNNRLSFVGASIPSSLPKLSESDENLVNAATQWKNQGCTLVYVSLGTVFKLTSSIFDVIIYNLGFLEYF